ncbi:MAG: TonB-dependent receptor [Geobacteraceae bacterium]
MKITTFFLRHCYGNRLCSAVLLALLVVQVSVCHAQAGGKGSSAPQDLTTLSIEELMKVEVATVSSASKYEQPVNEAPASVTIVTADEIKKFGYRNLADILQSVRGFSVTNDRNYQYVGVRGFGFPGDYGSRTLILVDGIRQNDAIYQSSAIGNDFVLDVDLIDRVEIIRGPSYSLYGSNAMLAVINVITKKGRDLGGAEVSGSAGSFDSYGGRLSYGERFASGPELLLSGTLYNSRGQNLYFPEFDSPSTNFGWANGCDAEHFGNAFLKFSWRDFTLEGAFVKRSKVIPTAAFGTLFNNSGTESWDSSAFLDLAYQHTFANELDLKSRFTYNQYSNDGHYVYDWADPGEPPVIITNIDHATSYWLTGELHVTKEVFTRHKFSGGLDFQVVPTILQQNWDVTVNLDDRRSSWNAGVYLQDEYQIIDGLILTAGLRYDHFDTFGGTLNPRLAIIYSPVARTSLKFLFGTGFRAPNGYELFYGDGETMKPNPSLREERSTSYELILEQYLGRRFRGTVAGYYTKVKDLVTQVGDQADGLLTYANVSEADMKGVELEFDKKWDNGVSGRISYSYQDGSEVDTGQWLVNSAHHLVKLNLLAPLYRDAIFFGVEEQYTGRKNTLSGGLVHDFFVTNATLFSRNLLKNLELSASVYNLLDTRYSVPAGGEHLQQSIEQDGRSFRVKATWLF